MASPVSSTAASPFPGLGSTGQSSAQATGSPTSAKVASARDQSFLEAIPVRSPTVIPLEWSFPLTHRGKSEGTDSGSLKMDGNTSISSTAQPAGSMATLAQPLVSNIPSYLASETPASSLQVPSPATVAPDPAGQAGSHPQKPWRIQWASYRVRLEDASTERDSASSAVHGRGSKTSALSTPHGGLLQVPHGYADLPLKPISPVANLFDRNMGKTRPRASSDASKKSSASRQSSQKRKKRRVGGRHSSVESDSPESTLRTFYGDHNQSAYQAVLDALHNTDKATRLQLLLDGKRQFLTRASNFKADLALQDGKNPESLLCQGHLPERLAIIEFGNEAVRSEDGGAHVAEPRLYTFSLSSPDLDLSVYTGLEESSCYRNLDPEGSGTFTASDLFPSLYNDNGIYNPPTSLHAASVHPVPSAAALVTGQSSGYGKAPLFLSSLNISSSSNKEALAASDAFLKAVEEHVLQTIIQEHSRLETGVGIDESESSDIRRNSAYNTFEGIRCGHGVLLSHRDAQMDNKSVPQGYTAARVTPTESVFISCQAHFTAADVRVSARLDACCLTSSPVHSRTSNLPSSGLKTGSSSIINSNPVDRGRIVILCPMSLPASFLRWYGQQSPDTPRKQAELELENIATAKSELADLLQDSWGNDMSVAYENDWLLCALSDGTHAIWPARLAMLLPTSLGKEHIDQSVKRVKQQTRIKSSIAKASTRVSRRIFFRPQATKSSDLARSSLSSIEHQNKERAKERRDKAEKVVAQSEHRIMVATSKAEAAQLSYITGPKLDEAADACINAVDLHRGNLPSKNGGPLPLNDLGCPTFESITLALDALAGPDSISPPATTQQPGIVVLPPLPKGNAMLHDEHNKEEASRIYPTPQSLQNAANQPVGDLSTSTDGGDISQQPQSPVPPATRTIADIFQDFSWPSYSDTQPVQVRDIPSRPPSGGSGYASRGGVFDDPSTFGLFDSAGLTDDDFSFFDSPTTTANVLDNGSVGQDQFHTQRARFTHVPDLTPYDLASFVRSGPVDHFGHLMPGYTGATEPQTTSLHSHAHPPVDLYGLQLSASDPNEILSMTDSASTAPPLFYEEKAVQQQLQDASEGAGHRLEVTTRPRYHVSVNGHSKKEATGFGSPSARLPKTTSAWPSSFGPVTFQYPSPSPSSSADSTLKGPAGSHDDQGWLTRHRWTLAQRLKETVNKAKIPSSNLSQYNGRNWREAGHAVAWSSESTSASSSDEVSDEDAATLVDQENRHVPKVRTPLRSRDVVYAGLETTKFPMLPRPNLARAKEPAIRVTRGEKEAVATIFFQHLIENMDFRERQTLQRSVKCLASPLSTRISPLPAANASRKANDAETTDIGVYFEDAVTSFSVSSLCVWSKLGLRPFNGTKNIQAVVVAAAALIDNDVSRALEDWLNRVSSVWSVRLSKPP